MTLKEELEILRGEPIQVFTGDPLDIPCIETSDPERLCKHPVVSVSMITYNHEPYIRQAIEGVMIQKTDFEFELVIGEDCSTDKTREICFEYQKKYPDKIRVLWWHKNSYQFLHPAGGNSARNMAHCRGEFIAICEGDDHWIDPMKLQKQVEIMRKHLNVGVCFTDSEIYREYNNTKTLWGAEYGVTFGLIPGKVQMLRNMFGPHLDSKKAIMMMTATSLIRKSTFDIARKRFDILAGWALRLGDSPLWLGLAAISDVYILPDITSVYNQNMTGASMTGGARLDQDASIVRVFYLNEVFKQNASSLPKRFKLGVQSNLYGDIMNEWSYIKCVKHTVRGASSNNFRRVMFSFFTWPRSFLVLIGMSHFRFMSRCCAKAESLISKMFPECQWLRKQYKVIDR